MDQEQILKLLMEIGPESSNAFLYWISLEVFKNVTRFVGWMIFCTVAYKTLQPFFQNLFSSKLLQFRELARPDITGEITGSDIRLSLNEFKIWKKDSEELANIKAKKDFNTLLDQNKL